ncbi:CYFA0S26e01178g1_1 [Cyberlindnera fabianii]|uniref:Anthranilate phosphoribosyltransferase n=1 Tax=Cyberlindnera fabianii TaxID=36022 RepID=A0A061BIS8_CYBFA|nr:Anthranilate phosphoribosyltransferase [Cyberlindnera fabianii]CDR46886.1 CYFA0S26e01178g1_1 [Cyberlindnera fabianii]
MSTDKKSVLSPFIKALMMDPPNLKPSDLQFVIKLIVQGVATDIQVASFLTALRVRGLDHHPDFIAAAATAVMEFSEIIDEIAVDAEGYVDVVGTGGDGQDTFNVSTSAAIVAAGMGVKVCKHGGKASTSTSGSGDLLGSLGVDLSKITATTAPTILSQSGFCFLFAPNFHPAMKKVAPIRSAIGIPTIFNILGPLLNPAPIRARIIGVNSESLGQTFAEALLLLDNARGRTAKSMIVWGKVGLDEISPIGSTRCWLADPITREITTFDLSPNDFGIKEHPLKDVASGTPQENANLLMKILHGQYDEGHPIFDYIVLNAAALAVVSGAAVDWKEGKSVAIDSIKSGNALRALQELQALAPI